MISLHLVNFRSYRDLKLTLKKGMTLIVGDSGAGKSTILMALHFVLYTFGTPATQMFGETGCAVEFDDGELNIRRTRRPNSLTLRHTSTGAVSIDEAAQRVIDGKYGAWFTTISYMVQGTEKDAFTRLESARKVRLIEYLCSGNSSLNVDKLRANLKDVTDEYKGTLAVRKATRDGLHVSECALSQVVETEVGDDCDAEYDTEEDMDKALNTLRVEMAENQEEERRLMEQRCALQEQMADVNALQRRHDELHRQLDFAMTERVRVSAEFEKESSGRHMEDLEADIATLQQMQNVVVEMEEHNTDNNSGDVVICESDILEAIQKLKDWEERESLIVRKKMYQDAAIKDANAALNRALERLTTTQNRLCMLEKDDAAAAAFSEYRTLSTTLEGMDTVECPQCFCTFDRSSLEIMDECSTTSKTAELSRLRALCEGWDNRRYNQYSNSRRKIIHMIEAAEEEYDAAKRTSLSPPLPPEYYDKVLCRLSSLSEVQPVREIETYKSAANALHIYNLNQRQKRLRQLRSQLSTFQSQLLSTNLSTPGCTQHDICQHIQSLSTVRKSLLTLQRCIDRHSDTIHRLEEESKSVTASLQSLDRDSIQEQLTALNLHLGDIRRTIGNLDRNIRSLEVRRKSLAAGRELSSIRAKICAFDTEITSLEDEYLPACNRLKKEIGLAAEYAFEHIVQSLDTSVNYFLSRLFADEEISVRTTVSASTGSITVFYKGHESSPQNLSGGEYARLQLAYTLALAYITRSELLLLDECVAHLDSGNATTAFDVIQDQFADTTYIVIVAHQVVTGNFATVITCTGNGNVII